jgi:adenosylhomocysteine/aminodeoxyfutalosine nucleosidase
VQKELPPSKFADLPTALLASGDAFVANNAEREKIRVSTNAEVVDMNSFGLMMVCQQTRTPTLIWKIVSDRANADAGEDFKEFIKNYDGEGGRMVREYVLEMPTSPLSPETYEHIRELMQ